MPTWSEPTNVNAGDLATAAVQNQYVLDNLRHLHDVLVTEAYTSLSNSVAETAVLSHTVKANYLGAKGLVRFRVVLLAQNSTGGNVTYTFKLKFGASNPITLAFTVATDADASKRVMLLFEGVVRNTATGNQLVWVQDKGTAAAPVNTNFGWVTDSAMHNSMTEDTTLDKLLDVTMTMGTASANAQWFMAEASLEGPFYAV